MNMKFWIQAILTLTVALFCLSNIASGRNEPVFWSTLSGILGYWLPTPENKQ